MVPAQGPIKPAPIDARESAAGDPFTSLKRNFTQVQAELIKLNVQTVTLRLRDIPVEFEGPYNPGRLSPEKPAEAPLIMAQRG